MVAAQRARQAIAEFTHWFVAALSAVLSLERDGLKWRESRPTLRSTLVRGTSVGLLRVSLAYVVSGWHQKLQR